VSGERGLRFAIVTEGPSDFLVLRSVLLRLLPESEVVAIQPEVPLAAYPEFRAAAGGSYLGSGWRGVRSWCQRYGGDDLELFLGAVVGDRYDALVIHVDASMAHNLGIEELPCPPVSATTEPLRQIVVREWLALETKPEYLLLATPSKSTDAWVLAAYTPDHPNVECDFSVERILAKKHKLPVRNGQVKKTRSLYEPLAEQVGQDLTNVRRACSEADRFAREVGDFAAVL